MKLERAVLSLIAALAIALAVMIPRLALAQTSNCAPFDQLAGFLLDRFGEAPIAAGVARQGQAVMAVFATPDGATWTLVALDPSGVACVLLDGIDWADAPSLAAPPVGDAT